jgi:hypothetical protein
LRPKWKNGNFWKETVHSIFDCPLQSHTSPNACFMRHISRRDAYLLLSAGATSIFLQKILKTLSLRRVQRSLFSHLYVARQRRKIQTSNLTRMLRMGKALDRAKRFLAIEKTAFEMAGELAVDVRLNNVRIYAAPLIVGESLSQDVVWVSLEWDSHAELASQAIFSDQASTLEAKIKSMAIAIQPEWTQKKLSITMDSFKNLQAELTVRLFWLSSLSARSPVLVLARANQRLHDF